MCEWNKQTTRDLKLLIHEKEKSIKEFENNITKERKEVKRLKNIIKRLKNYNFLINGENVC